MNLTTAPLASLALRSEALLDGVRTLDQLPPSDTTRAEMHNIADELHEITDELRHRRDRGTTAAPPDEVT